MNNPANTGGRPLVFAHAMEIAPGEMRQKVEVCPFCGGSHQHGIAHDDSGVRRAHCGGGEYQIFLRKRGA